MKMFLVAGLGQTGRSIARYLQRRNQDFIVFDTRQAPPEMLDFQKEFPQATIFLQDLPEKYYSDMSAVIVSPGIMQLHPVIQKARALSIPVYGDIECLAREVRVPVVAITGTNGKSTVTTLVRDMAQTAGLAVAMAGNIGCPVLDLLDDGVSYDLWVIELSSFQLDLCYSLAPTAATILNITPDHLDRHGDFISYQQAKQRIYMHAQQVVYNRDDQLTCPAKKTNSSLSFGLDESNAPNFGLLSIDGATWLACGQNPLISVDDLKIKGRHNWENALAAIALAQAVGVSFSHCMTALQAFTGLQHRCQWVRTLSGVDYINDSKGTNVGATCSALHGLGASIQGKIVLIAGGQGKGADFTALNASLNDYVRQAILIGTDAQIMEKSMHNTIPITLAHSLEQAVSLAASAAKAGDIVLLSPACASFDMFRDFNHRGECFAEIVGAL